MKSLAEKVEATIAPSIADMGYELVQVKFMDGKSAQTLQIMAERPDGSMSVDDCAKISRQISAVLDVEDVIPNAYRLEVSSPGIDRPLVKLADYPKYIGHTVKVEMVLPVDGRKRFTGAIKAVEGENVVLAVDNYDVALPFEDIQSAKLVLTDALIQMHLKDEAKRENKKHPKAKAN